MDPATANEESRFDWVIPLGLAVIFAATVAHSWGRWGDIYVDAGGALDRAARVAEGEVLYRDVRSPYGPLGSYTLAAAFRVFGIYLTTAYLLAIALLAAQGCALWTVGRRFLGRWETAFGVVMFWLLLGVTPDLASWLMPNTFASILGAFFSTLTLALGLGLLENWSPTRLVVGSLSAALAGLAKVEFGLAAVGTLLLAVAVSPRPPIGRFKALMTALWPGALLTVATTALIVLTVPMDELLGENLYRKHTLAFVAEATRSWATVPLWPKLQEALIRYGCELPARAVAIAFGATLLSRTLFAKAAGAGLIVLAIGLPLAPGYPALKEFLGMRHGLPYYWAPTVWIIVAAIAATIHWRSPSSKTGAILITAGLAVLLSLRWDLRTRLAGYYGFLGPFLLLLVVRTIGSAVLRRKISQWAVIGVFVGSFLSAERVHLDAFRTRVLALDFPRGFIAGKPRRALPLRSVIEHLREHTREQDTVLVLPEERLINFLAERRNPTADSGIGPGWLATPQDEAEFIAEVEASRPAAIVVSTRRYPEFGSGELAQYAPEVSSFIELNYRKGRVFGNRVREFTVYRYRKDRSQ